MSKTSVRWHGIFAFAFFSFFVLHLIPHGAAQSNSGTQIPPLPKGNIRPSMTVTIAVLAVACVFIALFSFYIRRCSRDIHINGGRSIRFTRTTPAPRGLDSAVIETFPTFLYSVVKGLKIGKGVLECAVCLNEFEDDETLRLLPKCDHVFHPDCIDAWLSSHTTCPVCRADLIPNGLPSEVTPVVPESDIRPAEGEENPVPEISESQSQVLIRVIDDEQNSSSDQKPDVITFPIQNRPVRSKSTRKGIAGRFPRSHSTGHSLVQPGENLDRFTLRLPDDVRKQILNGKLNRTTSCVTFPRQGSVSGWSSTRNASVRRSSGSSKGRNSQFGPLEGVAAKSGRWGFLRPPSFLWRSNSASRLSKKGGDGSVSAKTDGMGQSSSVRPPV